MESETSPRCAEEQDDFGTDVTISGDRFDSESLKRPENHRRSL